MYVSWTQGNQFKSYHNWGAFLSFHTKCYVIYFGYGNFFLLCKVKLSRESSVTATSRETGSF